MNNETTAQINGVGIPLRKPTGVQLRNLERRYMEEQKQIVEMNQTQQPPWMINNLSLCYLGERCNGSDNERKQHFLQHKKNTIT